MSTEVNTQTDSVLEMIYDAYCDQKNIATDSLRTKFKTLYGTLCSKNLTDFEDIVCMICILAREHERNGFAHGVRLGMMLYEELSNLRSQ